MKMSAMKWTDDQLKAINYPTDRSACVSAAAGSGKTALLIERVVTLIRGNEEQNIQPVPADSFAILTFTRNAAEEFRTRMTQAIEKASRSAGSGRIPREQLIKFRSSYIGTINSFCLGVLRDNPQLFDLPVNFSIVEEGRATVMMNRALDNTMEYFYSESFLADLREKIAGFGGALEDNGTSAREQLLKTYSFTDDEELRKDVKNIYYKSTSLADRSAWLNDCAGVFSSRDRAGGFFLPFIVRDIPDILATINKNVQRARECTGNIVKLEIAEALNAMLEKVEGYATLLDRLCRKYLCGAAPTFDDLDRFHKELDGTPIPVIDRSSVKRAGGSDTANKSGALTAMERAVACFVTLNSDLGYDSAAFELERVNQLKALSALVVLVERLETEFRAIKRKAAVVDFADCEQMLLEELRRPGSELRGTLSQRYRCIIIDEFQDTNDLQYTIFSTISREKSNLFFVGDIKQSIYAFRGGNPEIMARCCEDGSGFEKLPLNRNFRSRESVISTVNAMFEGIMTRTYGDVDYSDNNQLIPGAAFEDNDCDYSSELHILQYTRKKPPQEKADEAAKEPLPGENAEVPASEKLPGAAVSEARYTAGLISRMVANGFRVKDKNGGSRPCTYSDFAVLLRNKTHIGEYKAELESVGIPAASDTGDYLQADEINLILSYLKIIDNPQLDEHLLPVLMSPLYGFTANELSLARLGILAYEPAPSGGSAPSDNSVEDVDMTKVYGFFSGQSLFGCIMDAAGSDCGTVYVPEEIDGIRSALRKKQVPDAGLAKCMKFAADYMDFRSFAANNSVERLIRHIYDNTDLFSVISTYERGNKKLANIRYLLTYTKDFEKYGGGTLNDFLRYTDSMKSSISSLKEAAVPQEAADSVKLMTFHASKGLQWPIVILGQLGANMHDDGTNTMIIDRRTGIGLKNAFIEQRRLAYSLGFNAAKLSVKRQQKGEELRVLYVAMTRAEEKLIMVGCCPAKKCADLMTGSYTAESVLSGRNYLEWILPSMYRYSDQPGKFPEKLEKAALRMIQVADRPESDLAAPSREKTPEQAQPDLTAASYISDETGKKYAYSYDAALQSRFSVTELAHRSEEQQARKAEEALKLSDDPESSDRAGEKAAVKKLTRPGFMSDDTAGIRINGFLVGNTYHHIMELFPLETLRADYSGEDMEAAVENGITELIENSMLTPEECYVAGQKKSTFVRKVTGFFLSRLGREMLSAQRVEREYPIFAELPACELLPDSGAHPDSRTILQGRIDMLYVLENRVVVVDYKSDSRSNLEQEMGSYCQQVMLYRKVLPLLMKECGSRTIELYLYSFEQEREINVEEAAETANKKDS